jgi:hypothetical protein
VRPGRATDKPRSFIEALKYKYAGIEPQDAHTGLSYVVGPEIRISGKQVEEVGFDKINKQLATLEELKIVILDGLRISTRQSIANFQDRDVGTKERLHIADTCPKITQLDVSRNLFEEIDEIGLICSGLQDLVDLRLE